MTRLGITGPRAGLRWTRPVSPTLVVLRALRAWVMAGRGLLRSLTCAMAALLLLSAGCGWGGASSKPDWLTGTSPTYPNDRYITGLGEAESVSSATERAYASVAKVFRAEVSSQAHEWESYLVVDQQGRSRDERRLTLDHVTNVTTDKVVENVVVLDKWYDAAHRRYAVLAGLTRTQGEAATLAHVRQQDETVTAHVAAARAASDPLTRLRALTQATKALLLREAFNADLRVLRLDGQGVPAAFRLAELTTEMDRLVAALPIDVEVVGDHAESVRRALTEGLLQEGLTVAGTDADLRRQKIGNDAAAAGSVRSAALLLRGRVQVWPIELKDPQFQYVRWCGDFVLLEPATQHVVGAVSRGDKVGHLSVQEAAGKALRTVHGEVSNEVAKTVAAYVYGDREAVAAGAVMSNACPQEAGGGRPTN